jgi:phosphoribosylaminoimidazole carboxylase PurK protein
MANILDMESIKRIGFLGGGQLSRMLVESLHQLRANGETGAMEYCLVEEPNSPVTRVTSLCHPGSGSESGLAEFIKSCDAVTFENEFIDTKLLSEATFEKTVQVRPSVENLEKLQNKLFQKELLNALSIPCAKHQLFTSRSGAESIFGSDYILKWANFGYDGKGVLFVNQQTKDSAIEAFLALAKARQSPVFAEEKIHFEKEIAILVARNPQGEILIYPPVQTEQSGGVCEWVSSLDGESEKNVLKVIEPWIRALATELQYVGVLAIEMFQAKNGFVVNELAPRVHNSGHYSQLALSESQFISHMRAVLGLRLKQYVKKFEHFGMMNLLGPSGREFLAERPSVSNLPPGAELYWYDKVTCKPGRKMGHVNFAAQNQKDFLKIKQDLMFFRSQLWQP